MSQKELYHYGVKGMKWGVRRYQNKDGTLTPAGKKRAKQSDSSRKEEVGNNKAAVKMPKSVINSSEND